MPYKLSKKQWDKLQEMVDAAHDNVMDSDTVANMLSDATDAAVDEFMELYGLPDELHSLLVDNWDTPVVFTDEQLAEAREEAGL